MILSKQEIMNFEYILPVQGSLETLELVQRIITKLDIVNDSDIEHEIDFDVKEIQLLKTVITFLDQNQRLNIKSLSLIHKILKEQSNEL